MRDQKTILSALLLIYIIISASCSCPTCGSSSYNEDIPEKIIEKAELFIISKTGPDFYEENIYPDPTRTKFVPPYYHMYYAMVMKDKDFVAEQIYFTMDTTGRVLDSFDIVGIPNCKDEPDECRFNINKEEAVEIAKENGLAEGIRDWEVGFRWSSDVGRYVWHVLAVKSEFGSEENNSYKAKGEEIMINPNDGSVLKFRKWEIN